MISGIGISATVTSQGVAALLRPTGQARASGLEGQSFSAALVEAARTAAATLQAGEAAAMAGVQGQLSPQRVVEQVLAAERTLQTVIAVRDKLVGAYLEISRMQI